MNLEEFRAKCAEAIKEYHDPKQDGPLLVAIRDVSGYSAKDDEWEEPFTEYAGTIGHWPKAYLGESCPDFTQFASEVITDLKRKAQELWTMRQPEPEEEYCSDCNNVINGHHACPGRPGEHQW